MNQFKLKRRHYQGLLAAGLSLLGVLAAAGPGKSTPSAELNTRISIAAAKLEDAVVVDCQLPGKLQRLGGLRTYLTPGVLTRLPAIECRTRGGEYTLGDLAGGNFSLQRWLPLADQGNVEAQYYVARIYANGMGEVKADYSKAAEWYSKAAMQKYPPALQELGYLYEQGLGVEKDPLKALNLQRDASGLGDSLDYAWKITATKEEAERRIAELGGQLDDANAQLQSEREQLLSTNDALERSRTELSTSAAKVSDLRSRLASHEQQPSAAGNADVKQLQVQLAQRESELKDRQRKIDELTSTLTTQESQLAARFSSSQSVNNELNMALAAGKAENQSLSARLAQSERRLLQSQQELSVLQINYRREAATVAEQREQLGHVQIQDKDALSALAASKQREIEQLRQQLENQAAELAKTRQSQTATVAGASKDRSDSVALARSLTSLQARYNDLQQRLQAEQQHTQGLRSQSKEDQSLALQKLNEELVARTTELDKRKLQIASLQVDAERQRSELTKLRSESSGSLTNALTDARLKDEALRETKQKLAEMRESLERLQTDSASDRLALAQERDQLRVQLAKNDMANKATIGMLQADLKDKQASLDSKQRRIDQLQQQLASVSDSLVASNVTYRMPKAQAQAQAGGASGPSGLLTMIRNLGPANYYALIIGNDNYRFMGNLTTPISDAQSVAEVLQQRYGFNVRVLRDATSDQLMTELHSYAMKLTDADRLLIYYAGHGGSAVGPPERAFWLGVNANPDTQVGWLSAEMVRAKIKEINARHILVVSDSCFSAAITKVKSTTISRHSNDDVLRIEWNRRATMVMTSGQDTPVVDSAGDRTHSLFAKYFIQSLRQNQDVLTGESLAYDVSSRVQPEAQRMGLKQVPTYTALTDANHNNGEFFFVPIDNSALVASLDR